MIDKMEVFAYFNSAEDVSESEQNQLMACCERACSFIMPKIKDDIEHNDPRVVSAAAGAAKFFLFCSTMTSGTSFKAGDVTISRDQSKQYDYQYRLFNLSMAQAADVLKDGGFSFVSV